jgi:thiamine biosynthesis lipoprotein
VHDGVREALLTPSIARFERRAMGSPLRLTVVGVDEPRAAAGWAAVSDTIEDLEQALSRFRATSDLVALNRRAGSPEPSPVARPLARALAAADRAHRVTGGAFDPRVLADLERLGYRGAPLDPPPASPGDSSARAPGATSDHPVPRPRFDDGRWLRLEPRDGSAAVAAPLDLGGIGEGLALRWAFGVLGATLDELWTGAAGALLEAGGDLVARGLAPQPGPWLVGIESPLAGEEIAVLAVDTGAVCTSSIGVHAWTAADGRAVHHLLDPRSGEPGGAGLLSVTVAGPDPAWAEVWSKALFLEGSSRIGARARALGLAAWWIEEDGAMEMTPAARTRTAWLAAEA